MLTNIILHCPKHAHGIFALSVFFCVPLKWACLCPDRPSWPFVTSQNARQDVFFFTPHTQPENKDAELVCVHLLTSPGCVQRGRATWTTRSSCSVPALHLPVLACWETSRWGASSSSNELAARAVLNSFSVYLCQQLKQKYEMLKKCTFLLGMCAELPPGAFRVSGGLHRRGGRQRLLLPQSPDLTCGRVVLQRLRWQRSLALYGQPPFFAPFVRASGCDIGGGATICMCLLCAGSDKPGVPGEKGLPSTSIRNHSSGEETFSKIL